MSRGRQKQQRAVRTNVRRQIAQHVASAFPGCTAEFVGQQSRAALKGRTFGFRVRDAHGRHRSNIVWVDPAYAGEINQAWVIWAVEQSNG